MPVEHKVESKEVVGCQIQVHRLKMPPELEAKGLTGCLEDLRKQSYPNLSLNKDADKAVLMEALRRGELKDTEHHGSMVGKNIVVDGFFTSLFAAFSGAASNALEMKYAAIGTNGTTPTGEDTTLNAEAFRFELGVTNTERYVLGKKYYSSVFLNSTQGDLSAGDTTVDTGTWSTTAFDVVDASALAVGDRIEVQTPSGTRNVSIATISTNSLTVTPALPTAPVAGATVKRLWAEYGLFMGPSATSTADTGVLVNHEIDDLLKGAFTCVFDIILTWAVV